jgi:hypothetical protein
MLNRTLCLAVAVLVGAALTATATVLAGDVWARQRPGLWVLAITQGLLVIAFVGYSRRRVTVADAAVAMLLAAGGLVAATSLTWSGRPSVSGETMRLLPVQALQVQLVCAAMLFRRRRWALAVMVGSVVATVVLTSGGDSVAAGVSGRDWVPPVGFALSAMVLIRALRNAAWDAAHLADRRRDVRANVVAGSHAQLADDEGRRLVHDRVLGALAAVAAGRDPDAVARACQRALSELTLLDPTASASALRDALLANTHPRVRVVGAGWQMSPPARVTTAFCDSAGEAIRNAGLHAGVDEVSVELATTRAGQAAVIVRDTGSGFDPAQTPGFGLSESIVARMGQVGGEVLIESSPGMGTSVSLLWPHRSSLQMRPQVGVLAPGHRSGLYVGVMLPAIVAIIYMAVQHAPSSSNPGLSVGLAALLAAAMLRCARYVGRGRPSWLAVVAIAIFHAVMTILVLSLGPERSLLSLDAWVVMGCSVVIGSVSLEARLGQSALLAAAEVTTVVAFAFRSPYLGAFEPVGALIMPIACAAMSYAFGALLRRGSTLVSIQDALADAEMDESGWIESAQAARRHYATQLQANVAPFLAYCATAMPPASAQLSARAATLAAHCRDLLALSETMPPAIRAVVLEARERGVRVAVRDAPSVSPVAWAVLSAVLRNSRDSDAVTLIPARQGTPARVTTIPRVASSAEADIRADLRDQVIWIEYTDVTTSFIPVSPEWGTSTVVGNDLGSTS